jgi:hypothetical protein
VLEFVEEALDQVALAVEFGIDDAANPDVALARNVGLGAGRFDQFDDCAGEEAAIGNDVMRQTQPFDERGECRLVRGLTGREQQSDRKTVRIDDRVYLGAQSSARTANGVIRPPFLPPAACWCARMIELSMRCIECGECCARASNTRTHTPALAQRLKRL